MVRGLRCATRLLSGLEIRDWFLDAGFLMLDSGYAKEGKRLSGYQKIRVQVISTAGYQVKEQKVDG